MATKKNTAKATQTPKKTKQPEVVVANTILNMILPWNEFKHAYDHALKESAPKVKTAGFRQGKVPLKVAEEQLGRDNIINHALEHIVPEKYEELIKKEKKTPVTHPQIRLVKMDWGSDFELEVQIAERPEIKLGSWKKEVTKGLKVADKQIKEEQKKAKEEKINEREIKLHQIFRALVEAISPQIPELLLKEKTKEEINRLVGELEKISLSFDDYLARRKQSFEEVSGEIAAQTLGQLQLELILEAIETELAIKVTDKDQQVELDKIEDEKVRQQVANNDQYNQYLVAQIKRKKLLDQLLAN